MISPQCLIRLPVLYGVDAVERLGGSGGAHSVTELIHRDRRYAYVRVSPDGLADMLDDARHYADNGADASLSLVKSARRAVPILAGALAAKPRE